MAFAFDATYGGKAANAYLTEAEANEIVDNELLDVAAWAQAAPGDRTKALLAAARDVDALLWHGARYYFDQRLAFPRTPPGSDFPYGQAGTGASGDPGFAAFLEQDEYLRKQKDRVQRASAIQAAYLLRVKGRRPEREAAAAGITSRSFSGAGVSESQSLEGGVPLHPDAWGLLMPYAGSPKLLRGDGGGTPEFR